MVSPTGNADLQVGRPKEKVEGRGWPPHSALHSAPDRNKPPTQFRWGTSFSPLVLVLVLVLESARVWREGCHVVHVGGGIAEEFFHG
jgi:hypothetical protein